MNIFYIFGKNFVSFENTYAIRKRGQIDCMYLVLFCFHLFLFNAYIYQCSPVIGSLLLANIVTKELNHRLFHHHCIFIFFR
jgi:hypothetical protein